MHNNNNSERNSSLVNQFDKSTGFNVSSRYTVVNTPTILKQFEAAGFEIGSFTAARVSTLTPEKSGFQKHMIRLRPAGTVAVKGEYTPEVIYKGSYDGSSSAIIMLGVFRFVCANGMVTGDMFQSYKFRHVGDIMPNVLVAAHKVLEQVPLLKHTIQHWSTIKLSNGQATDLAMQAAQLVLPDGALLPTYADLLKTSRVEDNSQDLWTVFNRVQEKIVRGGLRYTTVNAETSIVGHRTTRKIGAIDRNVNLNKQLWDIASKFAA